MKKVVIFAAAAALVFASCNKNEHNPALNNNAVKFVVDNVITRVATTGVTSVFVNGDQVAITSNGLDEDVTNEAYEYTSGNGTLTGKQVCYKDDATTSATFVAHYPATLVNNEGTIEMTVASDQTDEEKFHNQMFMVATAEGNPEVNGGLVSFKFAQQLSFVKIVLDGIEATDVELNNVQRSVSWTAGDLTLGTDATATVNTWFNGNEYWALIPAQTIAAGTQLITIKTETGEYVYTLGDNDLEFTTANVKKVTLSLPAGPEIPKVDASFSNEGINPDDWTESTLGGEVAEKPYEPLVLISEEQGNFSNVTFNTNVTGMSAVTNLGWTKVINGERGTIEYNEENNCMALYSATADGKNAWHNLALVYRTDKVVKAKQQFKLSFEYKASALTWDKVNGESTTPTATQLTLRFLQPEVMPTNANIAWSGNQGPKPSSTEEFTKVELNVTIGETPTVSGVPTVDATLENGLLIVFGATASDDVTYYIKNVKFEEKVTTPAAE